MNNHERSQRCPSELLIDILRRLSFRDKVTAQRVCKTWNSLLSTTQVGAARQSFRLCTLPRLLC